MKTYAARKKVSEKYYTLLNKKGFVEIVGKPVDLKIFGVTLDAVLHNAEKDNTDFIKWNIIEQQIGMKINGDRTQKAALAAAVETLRSVEERMIIEGKTAEDFYDTYFKGKPMSPRYKAKQN